MKSLILSIILFNSLLSFDYKLSPKLVDADGSIYCYFGYSEVMDERNNGDISNSCFVNMGTSYLVIDSGSTFSYANQAYEKIKKIKNLPISYVLNTHVHDDHWLGNSYYTTQNAIIIGSESFRDLEIEKTTRMQRRISKEAYTNTTQKIPDVFVKKEKILNFDGIKVIIRSVKNKAHTDGDIYIYIPSKKVIFAGDLIFNDRIPSIRDGSLLGWIKALDEIRSLDAEYVIGGHGRMIKRDSLDMTYNYLKELYDGVSTLLEDGEDIADVVNILEMKKYKHIKLYSSMHRGNVEIAYRMLEWGSE